MTRREKQGSRIRSEHQLRQFIAGAIEADGFDGFMYQVARSLDAMAEDTLNHSHGRFDAHTTAYEYSRRAQQIWTLLHSRMR